MSGPPGTRARTASDPATGKPGSRALGGLIEEGPGAHVHIRAESDPYDPTYITRKHGKISKLIHFKKINNTQRTKIKGFEAPFTITADSRLIKIGYDAGFGNGNSAGLGCVKKIQI